MEHIIGSCLLGLLCYGGIVAFIASVLGMSKLAEEQGERDVQEMLNDESNNPTIH